MNSLLKKLRKHWILVWLVVAAVSFSAVIVFAIYTRVSVVKRVISTEAGIGSRFSSDHMSVNGLRTIEPISDISGDAEFDIKVFNYAYPKESSFRAEDTIYDLTATLGVLDDEENFTALSDADEIAALSSLSYSITYKKNNDTFEFGAGGEVSHTFESCLIPGNRAGEDPFTLVFDQSEFGETPLKYCMKLEATPQDSERSKLLGYVTVRYSKKALTGWNGKLEKLDSGKEYDGYNYYLEGSGKGKLTFRWDKRYVTINKEFLNNKDITFDGISDNSTLKESDLPDDTENTNMKKLTIIVDSTNVNRYEVQFFKIDPSEDYSINKVAQYLPDTTEDDWASDQ